MAFPVIDFHTHPIYYFCGDPALNWIKDLQSADDRDDFYAKYYYVNDPLLYPLYACAQGLQVPIMVHTGTSLFKGVFSF